MHGLSAGHLCVGLPASTSSLRFLRQDFLPLGHGFLPLSFEMRQPFLSLIKITSLRICACMCVCLSVKHTCICSSVCVSDNSLLCQCIVRSTKLNFKPQVTQHDCFMHFTITHKTIVTSLHPGSFAFGHFSSPVA